MSRLCIHGNSPQNETQEFCDSHAKLEKMLSLKTSNPFTTASNQGPRINMHQVLCAKIQEMTLRVASTFMGLVPDTRLDVMQVIKTGKRAED